VRSFEEIQRENEANRRVLGILHNKDSFRQYVADTRRRLDRARGAIDQQGLVRRELHTIKGDSAMHGLDPVVEEIHRIEEAVTILPRHVEQVAAVLGGFLAEHRWAFGVDLDAARREVVVDDAWLARMAGAIRLVPPPAGEHLRELHRRATLCPASSLLGPIDRLVANLAARLGKQVELVVEGRDVVVDPAEVEGVFRQLPHLVRNAVDHGIEPPEERGEKPETARLVVAIEERRDGLALIVSDDGRGIDREALVAKAIARRLLAPGEAARLSDGEVLALIFHDGLSTAREVSAVSGRGVGMAAVRAAVEERGGCIAVHSVPGAGTTFELFVPHAARAA
jgi:chemotaxis protein histidine kinase CheA